MMRRTVVDINLDFLDAARKQLGTTTVKDTVNQALEYVARERLKRQRAALARYPPEDIGEFLAWRRARDARVK